MPGRAKAVWNFPTQLIRLIKELRSHSHRLGTEGVVAVPSSGNPTSQTAGAPTLGAPPNPEAHITYSRQAFRFYQSTGLIQW